jgi:hypothetical protein
MALVRDRLTNHCQLLWVASALDPHGHILGFVDWKHDMNNKLKFTSSTGDIHFVLRFLHHHTCKFCIRAAPSSGCNT